MKSYKQFAEAHTHEVAVSYDKNGQRAQGKVRVTAGSHEEAASKAIASLGHEKNVKAHSTKETGSSISRAVTEGTIQANGTDKIDPAAEEIATKKKTDKEMEDEQQNESYTFDAAAMAKQELADAKNKKHRKRGKVANLLRKLGMKEETEIEEGFFKGAAETVKQAVRVPYRAAKRVAGAVLDTAKDVGDAAHKIKKKFKEDAEPTMGFKTYVQEAYGRRDDSYTRDYKSSVSGMGKHQSAAYHADGGANDEGWGDEHHSRSKPADHPHAVHINGKKWKTFGSHSHATNVARKIKGATVHKEESMHKNLQAFVESLNGKKTVNVDKVQAAGEPPHEEKWEDAKKVKKESYTADQLLQGLKEGLWPGTPEYKAKFDNNAKQGGGAGVKKGSRYGGSLQKPDNDNDADDKPADKKNK